LVEEEKEVPIYEYRCEKCGHRVEVIQKFSDPPLTECPNCKGSLTKVLAPPALQFKGSGFYITDYSTKGKPPKTEAESSAKKEGEKSSSKPQTSSETKEPSAKK
jgi:putative FmdB family regulatory protein